MERRLITLPPLLATEIDWDIDWREQSSGTTLSGTRKIEITALPRWIGTPKLQLHRGEISIWRAHRWAARGQTGVFRVQMRDGGSLAVPPSGQTGFEGGILFADGTGWAALPQISCPQGAPAGADELIVDETEAPHPVRLGALLSHDDWPFAVTARQDLTEGPLAGLTWLAIEMPLRRAIPPGGLIDMAAFGLFELVDPRSGNAAWRATRFSEFDVQLQEVLR